MAEENKTATRDPAAQTFLSPAKINLFLRVLGRRPDGYHEIRSLIQPVSLFDELSIEVLDGDSTRGSIEVTTDSTEAPGGAGNLAHRAAAELVKAAGVKKNIRIHIKKKIPVGAGLGGGSSDAATVLMALNDLLKAGLSERGLMELAAALGSDVPFFILKGAAIAEGRGELLRRVEVPPYSYVLVNPGFAVQTAWVYNNLSLTKTGEDNNLSYSDESFRDIVKLKDSLANDLETVTVEHYPEILALKDVLVKNGASVSLMSGSGPTVFGLFTSDVAAKEAYVSLKGGLGPGTKLFLVHGLSAQGGR
jgi:4-diphosphocytidyl-2-C-methyl-D-erythritol kinase